MEFEEILDAVGTALEPVTRIKEGVVAVQPKLRLVDADPQWEPVHVFDDWDSAYRWHKANRGPECEVFVREGYCQLVAPSNPASRGGAARTAIDEIGRVAASSQRPVLASIRFDDDARLWLAALKGGALTQRQLHELLNRAGNCLSETDAMMLRAFASRRVEVATRNAEFGISQTGAATVESTKNGVTLDLTLPSECWLRLGILAPVMTSVSVRMFPFVEREGLSLSTHVEVAPLAQQAVFGALLAAAPPEVSVYCGEARLHLVDRVKVLGN